MADKAVLQYGSLAGWPFKLAEGLKSIGQDSVNVIPEDSDFADLSRRLPFHEAISSPSSPRPIKVAQRFRFLLDIPERFSLVHYHASHLLRGSAHHLFEGPYLARNKVPMIVSFAGSDARIISKATAKNPYFFLEKDPVRDARIEKYLSSISKHVRYAATDCEMAEYISPYFEHVFTFRQPACLDELKYSIPRVDRPPVFLHVPTDTEVKGTSFIISAIERLRAEGFVFEFRVKRKLTQSELYREISDCDVYIDELRCGSHGVTAVEAMAIGKPTISYIRGDLLSKYPADLPLVNANPDSIYDELKKLVGNPSLREKLSRKGRCYVEKYHELLIVSREMLDVYREIGLK